eukprot:Hpha_TRINITY_DN15133_c7_g1::TRINITY_DN15133_c7_g1_i2::g.127005::m.127005
MSEAARLDVPGSDAAGLSRRDSVHSQHSNLLSPGTHSRPPSARGSQLVRQSSSRSKTTAPPVASPVAEQPPAPAPTALDRSRSSAPGTPKDPQPPLSAVSPSLAVPMATAPLQRIGSGLSGRSPAGQELDRSQSRRSATLHQLPSPQPQPQEPQQQQQQQPQELVPPTPGTSSIAPDAHAVSLGASYRSHPPVDATMAIRGSMRSTPPVQVAPFAPPTPATGYIQQEAPATTAPVEMQAVAENAASAAVAELHATLLERELEVSALQQRLRAYEAGMSQDADARVRTASEERERLAVQLREAEGRIRSLTEERDREIKSRDKRISDLTSKLAAAEKKGGGGTGRAQPAGGGGADAALIQRASAAEAQVAASAAQLSDLERRCVALGSQLQAARAEAARAVAVREDLQSKLVLAQDAIVSSTAVGYENEVRLHQARCALHLILRELSSPPDDGSAVSPSRAQFHLSPRRLQQVVSGAWGSSPPENLGSQLFADSFP